jgi:hypothetical protein
MSHGSSPAAWTAVIVCLVGFTIGGLALIPEPNWVLFWIGVGLTLGSAVVGRVLAAAGLGLDHPEL